MSSMHFSSVGAKVAPGPKEIFRATAGYAEHDTCELSFFPPLGTDASDDEVVMKSFLYS